jgi:hypothetical protein
VDRDKYQIFHILLNTYLTNEKRIRIHPFSNHIIIGFNGYIYQIIHIYIQFPSLDGVGVAATKKRSGQPITYLSPCHTHLKTKWNAYSYVRPEINHT